MDDAKLLRDKTVAVQVYARQTRDPDLIPTSPVSPLPHSFHNANHDRMPFHMERHFDQATARTRHLPDLYV